MQLQRLRLANFRQHESTDIEFGAGITGIVGPNGSGKTTLLEALAWAIYGSQAARGDRDSIRRLGAKARANVEVEVEFRLGGHEYRVLRRLHDANLFQDGTLVANSLKAVTEKPADETGTCVGDATDGGSGSPTASLIAAISCCCVTMISCASRLICSLRPLRSTACAMSIAP